VKLATVLLRREAGEVAQPAAPCSDPVGTFVGALNAALAQEGVRIDGDASPLVIGDGLVPLQRDVGKRRGAYGHCVFDDTGSNTMLVGVAGVLVLAARPEIAV